MPQIKFLYVNGDNFGIILRNIGHSETTIKYQWNKTFDYLFFRVIPGFGVSTVILNIADFFRRCCKLNFGPLRGHVKSCHFPERIEPKRQIFTFLYTFLGIIGRKGLGQPFWIIIWVFYYLKNGIRLELGLNISCWIRTYLTLLQTIFTFRFFYLPNIAWPRKIKLANLDFITNCLTDNSSKFSDFSNIVSTWL